MSNAEQESSPEWQKADSNFPSGCGLHKEVTRNAPRARKKVEKTVSTIWMQPSSNPRIGLIRGIHADSLHTGHLPCLAGSKSLSKDSIHKLLGPTHHCTHTGRSYSQEKKHASLPKCFYWSPFIASRSNTCLPDQSEKTALELQVLVARRRAVRRVIGCPLTHLPMA